MQDELARRSMKRAEGICMYVHMYVHTYSKYVTQVLTRVVISLDSIIMARYLYSIHSYLKVPN
jgi:hypothetical protein